MESVKIKRKSPFVWLAAEWGDLWIYNGEDTVVDICSFRWAVIKGLIKLLFVTLLSAGISGVVLYIEFKFAVGTYKYLTGAVEGTYKEVLGRAGWAGLTLNAIALLLFISILGLWLSIRYNAYRKAKIRAKYGDDKKPEPSLLKRMYLSWKQKLCYNVTIPSQE